MRLIVTEAERVLLFKNGVFKAVLGPGKHWIWKLFGETVQHQRADGAVIFPGMSLVVLNKNADFASSTAGVEVPDGKLCVHFIDGRIIGMLGPGAYAYWNVLRKHTFELIDVADPEAANSLPAHYLPHVPQGSMKQFDVGEGEAGLLFFDGVFRRALGPGRYRYWTGAADVAVKTVETRAQQLDISGQEILTADKVSLRVNFVLSFRVADPVSAVTKHKDFREHLYVLTQLALRELAGKYRLDELLRQKDSIGGFVLERLKPRESELFVELYDAGIKDIILPGEIRDIMNTVLVAEKAAQASVITRREETAATRSLLETARLMDENATLFKLKELEYLERICDKVGNISVGGGNILDALRKLVSGKEIG